VEEVDKLTARIVLRAPNVPFLAQLTDRAGMLVSPKAATALGADFGKAPVCAGPFRFVERIPQDRIVLERFAEYWDAGRIHLNRVVYQPIVDGSVRQANLRAGSIDFGMGFLPNDAVDLGKDNRIRLHTFAGLGYQSLTFNLTNGTRPRTPMMSDARVRKAFELSIDRTALIQVVYNGLYTPIAQMVPPNSPFYSPEVPPPARDVAKARALLAEAGVRTPLAVELMIANSPDARQVAEVIQSMAAEAGFDVKIRSTEFVTALQASDKGDFEMFWIGWSGRADADGNIWNMVRTGGPLNSSGYSNKEVDTLLEQARTVPDVAARRALYGRVAAQLHQDLPLMYVFSGKWIMATTGRVSGFQPVPDGLIRLQGVRVSN
jgi:peptide/nickel transport system substrate-binding protein